MGATGYEVKMYADIGRAADALQRIARVLEGGGRAEQALRAIANGDVPDVDFAEDDLVMAFAQRALSGGL